MSANDKIKGLLSASSVRNTIMAKTDKPVIIVDCDASWRDSFAALASKTISVIDPSNQRREYVSSTSATRPASGTPVHLTRRKPNPMSSSLTSSHRAVPCIKAADRLVGVQGLW
jgi:hypothetical protein